jgi:Protein of unknown function (DUF4012)
MEWPVRIQAWPDVFGECRAMGAARPSAEEPAPYGAVHDSAVAARQHGHAHPRSRLRYWTSAALAVLLLTFVLACLASVIPLLRVRNDLADAQRRLAALDHLFSGGAAAAAVSSPASLTRTLADAQAQVEGIQGDLQAINGLANLVGQPLSTVSPALRDDALLLRIGNDLSAAALAGLAAGQTLTRPLQVGMPGTGQAMGLTLADIQSAQEGLSAARSSIVDAVAAYDALDPRALPAQLGPGTKYRRLLVLLPDVPRVLDQAVQWLGVAPGLLGIGQPARYLVLLQDRTELRAGGGFQGNFGILTVQGGQESRSQPFALQDTYALDQRYYQNPQYADPSQCPSSAGLSVVGPQPPATYWWWPIRCFSNLYGWGLRDAVLSPDFPTNARTDLQIVADSGWLPQNTSLQGVIAFTPTLIEDVLRATGPVTLSAYNVTITADNLEYEIHQHQLGAQQVSQQDRKQFTHDLGAALLARLRHPSAGELVSLMQIAQAALQHKDLQVYFTDPQAEQLLNARGLASTINSGSGDGFFVVDTNDGGNKANAYVTERQTDVVTLLPDGGALHRLQIVVTYDKQGPVYQGTTQFQDYSDVQRTYLPSAATNLNYTQPSAVFGNGVCGSLYTWISDCSPGHRIDASASLTQSDVSGRTMVMEPFILPCGSEASLLQYSSAQDNADCTNAPQPHSQTVYVSWYTPHAYAVRAGGGGTYSEMIQKQPGTTLSLPNGQHGSQVQLAVYVSTSQAAATDDQAFAQLLAGATRIYDAPLLADTTVHYQLPGAQGA